MIYTATAPEGLSWRVFLPPGRRGRRSSEGRCSGFRCAPAPLPHIPFSHSAAALHAAPSSCPSPQKFISQFLDAKGVHFDSSEPLLETVPPMTEHPAGISKNWSLLYVWLQYAQWYKVLCWLLVLVLGGSEGLLPQTIREAFRVEELLLASETRAQVFIFGQCVPFVLTKARHFLVTWAGTSHIVRFIFYSAFTSHVEVASTLACDTVVAVR